MQTEYAIVEIFESLQGEGLNTGMPAIFIRFGKCNLACPWCDTDYQTFSLMTATWEDYRTGELFMKWLQKNCHTKTCSTDTKTIRSRKIIRKKDFSEGFSDKIKRQETTN